MRKTERLLAGVRAPVVAVPGIVFSPPQEAMTSSEITVAATHDARRLLIPPMLKTVSLK
jgi:hypothetical protein